MSVLHSWPGSRPGQLPSSPSGLVPYWVSPARPKRRTLTDSIVKGSRMVTIILLPLYFAHDPAQVLANGDCIGMLRPQNFLTDTERPPAIGLRLCIATLNNAEFGQIVEFFGDSGMLGSIRFLSKSEGSLPEQLGLLIISLLKREPCQQIEVVSYEGMLRPQDSFTGRQCLL